MCTILKPMYIDFSCQYDMEHIKKILFEAKEHYEQRAKSQSEPRLLSFDKKAFQAILQMIDKPLSLDEVKKRVQQIINEEENQIRLLKQFDVLYEEYEAISMIIGIVPKAKVDMTLEILKNEIDNLKEEYKWRKIICFVHRPGLIMLRKERVLITLLKSHRGRVFIVIFVWEKKGRFVR